jgi:hypothetical protein
MYRAGVRLVLLALPLIAGCARQANARVVVTAGDVPRPAELHPDIAGARELDQQGVRSYAEGRYADAVRLFASAYRAGGPPSELWNIARSHEKLDDLEGAAKTIEQYLAQGDLVPTDRAEAERELRALEARSSMLTVLTTPEGATVTIDGKASGTTPGSFEVRAGPHTLSVQREGYADEGRSLEARYGRALVVSLDLRPAAK